MLWFVVLAFGLALTIGLPAAFAVLADSVWWR